MNGRYERLILDLEPWLRGELRKRRVPGAYRLKALGDDCQDEGVDEGAAADVRAEVMKKALGVARDIESGQRDPPDDPEQYVKGVMWKALIDWFRAHPEMPGVSPDERALLDNELFSIDKDEGGEGFSSFPSIHIPTGRRVPARPPRPFLLTLVRQPFLWKPKVGAEYMQVQELLNAIPNGLRRDAVLLDLQGYRQEQIAVRLLVSQPYVSRVLREQYAAWGWDDRREKVQWIRYVTAYANLIRLFGRVFPRGGFVFPGSRPLYPGGHNKPTFHLPGEDYEEEDYEEEEFEFDSEEDPSEQQADMRRLDELRRIHNRSFELPREEEAYNRSRRSGYLFDEEKDRIRNPFWKPGPQQGSKDRRKVNRSKAQDAKLYQAIMNDPTLAPWTKNLRFYHMPRLVAWIMRDDYEYDYDDDDGDGSLMGLRPQPPA